MAEGMDEEQLVSFCHQLGLAQDGYLSEQDLSVVCRCIGLVAPEEMMKQLFDELDGDHDGRVCLAELSLMLRGMQLQPQPQKTQPYADKNGPGTPVSEDSSELPPIAGDTDHFTFSIFDPDHKGFAKVGVIIDVWSQLGISPSVGQQVLKELGFSGHSKSSSINLQDLGRSIDDETDHSKDGELPPVFLAALLTYRTEAQYLRTLCESMECERDKLKLDVTEAHQRSTMMAQEVDEQNARLEHNTQVQLLKMESKYTEQMQSIQQNMGQEKESLLQTIQQLESQLIVLRDTEDKLKSQITKLKEENIQLEDETKNLSQEVKHVTWLKSKVEDELARYAELEKGWQEMERQYSVKVSQTEEKLQRSCEEIQLLKDQNDELSSQLERMKDALDGMKSLEGKRFNIRRRRKKGLTPGTGSKHEQMRIDDDHDHSCVPLEKMGKFHQEILNGVMEHDVDDAESSLEHTFLSCSSQDIDSGNFQNLDRINLQLEGCAMDEAMQEDADISEATEHDQSQSESSADKAENPENLMGEYKKLQSRLKEVKEQLQKLSPEKEIDHHVISDQETSTRIQELEKELEELKSSFEEERNQLRSQCSDLENSLELLQTEYEKCEEYWHRKLEEERIEYEHDKNINDEKFLELAEKIKEYEELCLQETEVSNKLPPIEERASLERQFNDLDEECIHLREQLQSLQGEQQSAFENYQRDWEQKAREECINLEQQVKALQEKCQEYEIRLTSITDEDKEQEKHEKDSEITSALNGRVEELKEEIRVQKERHAEHVLDLERSWKRKYAEKPSQEQGAMPTPVAAVAPSHQHQQQYPPGSFSNTHRTEFMEVSPVQPPAVGPFWAQTQNHLPFYHYQTEQPLSLPYVPSNYAPPKTMNAAQLHNGFDSWSMNPVPGPHQSTYQQPKKTWCHVEAGWLQALRAKLKQREDQCMMLQRALRSLEQQHEKILAEMKFQHRAEISNWEDLMKGSQELLRQRSEKQKEQADKLAHADNVIKDLWAENGKLAAAFNSAQHRITYLESVLKNSGLGHSHPTPLGSGHGSNAP